MKRKTNRMSARLLGADLTRFVMVWMAGLMTATLVAAAPPGGSGASGASGASGRVLAKQPSLMSNLIVVFDGSGSMWGNMPGSSQPKFEVAREALRNALALHNQSARLGLVTFGLRSSGGCRSVSVAVGPDNQDRTKFLRPLERFNPRGRGPLVLGLRHAVEALAGRSGPRSIIVVHDDPDNCSQDVCAMAKSIAKSEPGLKVHVLSLVPKDRHRRAMACLPKITGGRLIQVVDSESSVRGLKVLVGLSIGHIRRPRIAVPTQRRKEPRKVLPKTPGLSLSAVLKPGGSPLLRGVIWHVKPLGQRQPAEGKKLRVAQKYTDARPSLPMKPGRYAIKVHVGGLVWRQEVTVKLGSHTPVAINLNAGLVTLSSSLKAGGGAYPETSFEVRSVEGVTSGTSTNSNKLGKPVWLGTAPAEQLLLRAGRYSVLVRAGQVRREEILTVTPGATLKVAPVLSAGVLTLAATTGGKGIAKDLLFTVQADDPTHESGRRLIAQSAAATPDFVLPAGAYYVSVRQGAAETQKLIVVVAGERVAQTLRLNTMALRLVTRLKGSKTALSDDIRYTVWRMGDLKQPVARTSQARPLLHLLPGRYRISSQIGRQNATIVRDFEVGSDVDGMLVLEHAVGTVQLSLKKLPAKADMFWRILNSRGRSVWRSVQPRARAILQAGTYTVVLDVGRQQFQDTVVVTSGQHVELALGGR